MTDDSDDNIISLVAVDKDAPRTYKTTIQNTGRRYSTTECQHRGPYIFDKRLAAVECGDCGASLNPLFVLEILARQEAYWNRRQKDLTEYLEEINEEIKGRTRTKCTHCGNMTAIKFKKEEPRTWVPEAY